MRGTLFITGASGFIAANFLQRIDLEEYENIYCLSRNESEILTSFSQYNNFKFIKGSIYDADLYTPYLASSDTVVHFAAITGKAKPEEYFKVNAEGTKFLIKQCEQLNVQKFLYISSISVKFTDISRYFYAQSKQKGEDTIKSSSLKYAIVRPTIVTGRESSILNNLVKLAKGGIIPIFGDGTTKIQPIDVDDLVDCLLTIINENLFLNETYDLGGPEIITIEDFVKRIHHIYYNKEPKTIHIPLILLVPVLSFLEKFIYNYMPFNLGQLSSFRFDGTGEENRIFLEHLSKMKSIDKMLEVSIGSDKGAESADKFNNECNVFCRYLIGGEPDKYVIEKYKDAHRAGRIKQIDLNLFDQLLVRVAVINPFFTKLADVYTSIFFKHSVVRKKLILLLAILECCEPSCRYFDSVDGCGKAELFVKMFQTVSIFVLSLLVSLTVFMPLHLICKIFFNRF